jgi:predicted N-acyltransferase
MLQAFIKVFGQNFLMFRYSLNGQTVGFVTGLKIGDTLHALHLGYDAVHTEGMHLYERCLFDMIDMGIQMGMKTVQMGRTATEIKSCLGAEPLQNSLVFFVRNPIFRAILRAYARYIYQPPPFTLRHPFASPSTKPALVAESC